MIFSTADQSAQHGVISEESCLGHHCVWQITDVVKRKRPGLSTDLFGMPDLTLKSSDIDPSKTTVRRQLLKKQVTHLLVLLWVL